MNNTPDRSVQSPFAIKNILLFITFRCLYNARFYYPVFTILFLDYGLTIEQFSLLNTVWAITIVCTEVPSGALADILGRKYLMVTTAILMSLEMLLLAAVPLGNSTVIFWVFMTNRILSGLAEAMASGADEAIAYDSLVEAGLKQFWPKVLTMQYRFQAITSVITLTLGSLVYSPQTVNTILNTLGFSVVLDQQTTMRFPVYLTLMLAIAAVICTLQMREVDNGEENTSFSVSATTRKTLQAVQWILKTPFALVIILFGMCYDHVLRLIATLTSQYFRCIELPDAIFGLIGASMSLLGLITPKIAEIMTEKNSPRTNMLWLFALTMFSLVGLASFLPYWGILFVGSTFTAMTLVSFFVSSYLNAITDSRQRATVLSFKGLAFNLAYGAIGVFFALLLNQIRHKLHTSNQGWLGQQLEDQTFIEGIGWLPWYNVIFVLVLLIFSMYLLKGQNRHLQPLPPQRDIQ